MSTLGPLDIECDRSPRVSASAWREATRDKDAFAHLVFVSPPRQGFLASIATNPRVAQLRRYIAQKWKHGFSCRIVLLYTGTELMCREPVSLRDRNIEGWTCKQALIYDVIHQYGIESAGLHDTAVLTFRSLVLICHTERRGRIASHSQASY